jgi:hypothetical protein
MELTTTTGRKTLTAQGSAQSPTSSHDTTHVGDLAKRVEHLLEASASIVAAGSIESAGGLADIIGLVHQARWSGRLRIVHRGSHREILFRSGEVSGASSEVRRERLGELLFRYGRISRQDLDTALEVARIHQRLGQVLVDLEMVTSHDLFTFLKTQVKEIFFAAVQLRQGSYSFERITGQEERALPDLGLSTQEMLFDGARLTDEMGHFRTRIPSSTAVPVKREGSSNFACLREIARQVYALIDGVRSIEEIGRDSKLGELEATRVVFQLMQAGQVELRRETRGWLPQDSTEPEHLITFVNHFLGTIESTMLRAAPNTLRREINTLVQGSTNYADLFKGSIADDTAAGPPLIAEKILANLTLVEEPLHHLQAGLNELLCFSLFVVGNRGEVEQRITNALRQRDPAPSGPPQLRIIYVEDHLEEELLAD